MRRNIFFTCLPSVVLFAVVLFFPCFSRAQNVGEIFDKYHQVIGGEANLRAIKSCHLELAQSAQGNSVKVSVKAVDGLGVLEIITVSEGEEGFELIKLVTPTEIWERGVDDYEPIKKTLTKSEEKGLAESIKISTTLAFLSLLDYKAEDHATTYVLEKKQKKVNREKCYVITATEPKENKKEADGKGKLFFSAKTGLLLRQITEFRTDEGDFGTVQVDYGEYKPVDGILFPHKRTQSFGGVPEYEDVEFTFRITAVRLNPNLAADTFTIEDGEYVIDE